MESLILVQGLSLTLWAYALRISVVRRPTSPVLRYPLVFTVAGLGILLYRLLIALVR